jgi:hypothetical protein
MLEIIALIIAITGIANVGRGRGVSPKLAGGMAFFGWLFFRLAGMLLSPSNEVGLFFLLAAWIWIAVVAGYLRFVVGAGRPQPDGKWNCSNCRYLNSASSVVCEACQQPWERSHKVTAA